MISREEHLAWCKRRALAYLPGDPQEACNSMLSDLGKHPEMKPDQELMFHFMMTGGNENAESVRAFIEGFN